MNFGIEVALISGGKGSSITDRAAHLGIKNVFTEIPDKLDTLEDLKNNLLKVILQRWQVMLQLLNKI